MTLTALQMMVLMRVDNLEAACVVGRGIEGVEMRTQLLNYALDDPLGHGYGGNMVHKWPLCWLALAALFHFSNAYGTPRLEAVFDKRRAFLAVFLFFPAQH